MRSGIPNLAMAQTACDAVAAVFGEVFLAASPVQVEAASSFVYIYMAT